jgi:predicted CXXCH cytochrome family protein
MPLPLYDTRGLCTHEAGKVGCASCHDPHTWSPLPAVAAAAKTDPRKVEGDGTNSFLRLPLDANSALCTNCHVGKAALALSKHNLAIAAAQPKDKGKDISKDKAKSKKPARVTAADAQAGLCSNCHQPHNAKGQFLWARDTGPGKGVTVGLCTSCHRDGGLAENKLTGPNSHPVGMKLLPGMKPNLPLFSMTGADIAGKDKDVVECASCHDPHQWDPANISSRAGADAAVEGDAANSFLRVSAAGRSDLCVECHRDQKLVRGTDHDMAVTAAKAVNVNGETVAESGVCGQCHLVHNAVQKQRLWARKPGTAPNAPEQLCRSCHVPEGIAKAKVPLESQHPAKVEVWSHALRARFRKNPGADIPVYDADGKPAPVGIITCTSCHNPHRWRADRAEEGPGKNTEGDVLSSFLRAESSEYIVCSDCHGGDALYRYKYFHGRSSHSAYPLYR